MGTRLLVGVHNSSELFAFWCLAVGEISYNMALLGPTTLYHAWFYLTHSSALSPCLYD